jgi:N-formylglutamate amidohydrolase
MPLDFPEPFRIVGDFDPPPTPLVLASPHSGRDYPPAFLAQTRLAPPQLRRAEDAYVDDLLADAIGAGVPMIAARYGRAFLDLNRAPGDLDQAMIADTLPEGAAVSERAAAGLGVVPRLAAHGLDIYAARIRLGDIEARVAQVHQPYHARLAQLVRRAHAAHGHAILLDCHSMPSLPSGMRAAAQIVLGDRHGQTAAPLLMQAIETQLTAAGLRVARNDPYAGGFTTAAHADPAGGIHVVQIEIDRALYMDPGRLQRHDGFAKIRAVLGRLAHALIGAAPMLGLAGFREAAE